MKIIFLILKKKNYLFYQTLTLDEPNKQAPKIVKKLPKKVKPKDGEVTKLEVKVKGKPKPKVKWLKQGEEIIPSEEYQIENFEDGTSILIINDLYPDDSGEITFEAYNPLGVAITTTELMVEEGNVLSIKFLIFLFFCLYNNNILERLQLFFIFLSYYFPQYKKLSFKKKKTIFL